MTRRNVAILLSAALLLNVVMPITFAVGLDEVAAPYAVTPRGPESAPLAGADDDIPGIPAPPNPIVDTLDASVDFDDVFSLDLSAGQVLTVSMAGTGDTDFDVYLFPPGSTTVTGPDSVAFSAGETYPEMFSYAATTTGTYYLDASAYAGVGSYTLTYSIGTAAVDDEIPGVPAPPSPIVGMVDQFVDSDDVFSLDLSAGQVLTVSMAGTGDTDFDVFLFPPGSASVLLDSPVASSVGETYPEMFSYTATTTGTYYLDVLAWEGAGSYTLEYSIGTPPVNVAPVLGAIGAKSVNELALLTFTASATDGNGDTLTFSLGAGAPSGASITSGGTFTWTPSEAQGPGSHPITVNVTDGALTDSEAITVTVAEVNVAPVLGAIGNKAATAGVPLTFTASATDTDLPANTKTFSLGAGAPAGASINPTTGAFSWTPAAAGSFSVTVIVSDGALTDTETITITVAVAPPVNVAPVLAPIGNKAATVGVPLTFGASATDANGDTLSYSLTGAPAGAAINASTGAFSWTPAAAGSFSITVRVSDGALTDTETITVTVAAAPTQPRRPLHRRPQPLRDRHRGIDEGVPDGL